MVRESSNLSQEYVASKLNLSQRQVPIVVRLPVSARSDPALLEQLSVPGRHGPVRRVPMNEVVFGDTWDSGADWAVDPPGTITMDRRFGPV